MAVIDRANDAATLLKFLLRELKLPAQCSHIQFVEAFAQLQKESKEYENELRTLYEQGLKKQEKVASNGHVEETLI